MIDKYTTRRSDTTLPYYIIFGTMTRWWPHAYIRLSYDAFGLYIYIIYYMLDVFECNNLSEL